MNNRRRNFRPRSQKSGFRRRNGVSSSNITNSFNNGNRNFNRNMSMNNINNVEKTIQKFKQLAKDAQSNGDPVLVENYLQHADHYLRRFNEMNEKSRDNASIKSEDKDKLSSQEEKSKEETPQILS